MGIATLRARAKDNRSLISRFFASFALLVVAASGIVLTSTPQLASAAENWNWVNEGRIDVAELASPWADGPFVDKNGKPVSFTFTDSNPYDTNRTFRDNDPQNTYGYCKDGTKNTLRMRTPGSGDYTFITTEVPNDYIFNHNVRVTCQTETRSVSVGSLTNAYKTIKPCPEGSQMEKCLEGRKDGNAEWARRCNYMDAGPGVPTNTPAFCQNAGTPSNTPTDPGGQNNDEPEKDECAALGDISWRWIACPLLTASLKTVGQIDGLLEEYLHYDTQIFDRSTDKGQNFYNAWSTFRGIALALVLLAGLVMVVSQGTGMQIFDAYTVKKVMPRLLIAVIGITLSWPILQFVITFFNDTGHWLQDIILMPFQGAAKSTGNSGIAEGFGGAAIIISAFTGTAVYAVALGPIGALSLAGTAALAVIVGLVVLIIRSVIITVAIIFAPLAIACYILPNTKKVWDFWQNALTTALMIFPIVMAFLAAGKALALVTDSGLMKVMFVIAPYFFLPFAFKLAGGLMSTVFSLTNDRGRGAFDRLRNVRQEQIKKRGEQWRDGRLFKEDGAFGKAGLNTAGLATGAFMRAERKGEMMPFTKKGRATLREGMTTQQRMAAAKLAGTDESKLTQFDDDQQRAQMLGASEEEARANLQKFYGYSGQKLESAIAAARANGGFSKASQIRAFEAAAASGTAINGWNDALLAADNIAGNNEQLRGQLAAKLKQNSVAAGRVEFGAGIGDIYEAMSDVREKAAMGQSSRFLDGHHLTLKAATGQDMTTILRGKQKGVKAISDVVTAELKNQNTQALSSDNSAERAAAQEQLAVIAATINAMGQNTQYSSMDNTVIYRNAMEVPTREIRENVKRAATPQVEKREPMRDANGKHMTDTAGNRLYEPAVPVQREVVVQTIQGTAGPSGGPVPAGGGQGAPAPAPGSPVNIQATVTKTVSEPERVQSTPDRATGEFGYRNDPTNPHNLSNTYKDLTDLRQPYGDPRDRRNIANEHLEKGDDH